MIPYFTDTIQSLDISVLNWIQENLATPFFDKFFAVFTHLGDAGILWIAIAVAMLFFPKTRKIGIVMGVALALGLLIGNGILKNVVGRVRPFDLDGAYGAIKNAGDLLISVPHDKSFPSGHTLASFEAAFVLILWNRKVGISAIVVASLIAFSRMYLYLHFPTDVLGAILLAAINVLLAFVIVNFVYKKFADKNQMKKI